MTLVCFLPLLSLVGFGRLSIFANLIGLKIEFHCDVFVHCLFGWWVLRNETENVRCG